MRFVPSRPCETSASPSPIELSSASETSASPSPFELSSVFLFLASETSASETSASPSPIEPSSACETGASPSPFELSSVFLFLASETSASETSASPSPFELSSACETGASPSPFRVSGVFLFLVRAPLSCSTSSVLPVGLPVACVPPAVPSALFSSITPVVLSLSKVALALPGAPPLTQVAPLAMSSALITPLAALEFSCPALSTITLSTITLSMPNGVVASTAYSSSVCASAYSSKESSLACWRATLGCALTLASCGEMGIARAATWRSTRRRVVHGECMGGSACGVPSPRCIS